MQPLIKVSAAIALVAVLGGLGKVVFASQPEALTAIVPERLAQMENQQDAKKLQSLAKISAEQAQKSAETTEKAKASRVTLENDDGNLVYAVVIGQKEVKVDAGNGNVLYTEALSQDGKEGKETKNAGTRLRSSIQVSHGDGDGDGETNDDG